jgi:hypothetical protein
MTAMRSAELDTEREQPDDRAWAHASLSELRLLSLLDDDTDVKGIATARDGAIEHARNILTLYPMASDFHVLSTKRQFARYVEWWTTDEFSAAMGLERTGRWTTLRDVAKELVAVLSEATDDKTGAKDEDTDGEPAGSDEE